MTFLIEVHLAEIKKPDFTGYFTIWVCEPILIQKLKFTQFTQLDFSTLFTLIYSDFIAIIKLKCYGTINVNYS